MPEYAFDAHFLATVRIQAESEAQAREKLAGLVEIEDAYSGDGCTITEISYDPDIETRAPGMLTPNLFEVDGEYVQSTARVQEPEYVLVRDNTSGYYGGVRGLIPLWFESLDDALLYPSVAAASEARRLLELAGYITTIRPAARKAS